MRRRLGLNLVAALLVSGVPFMAKTNPVANKIITALPSCLTYSRKEVYTLAATVVGTAMRSRTASVHTVAKLTARARHVEESAVDVCYAAQELVRTVRKVSRDVAKTNSPKELPHFIAINSRITERFPPFLDSPLVSKVFQVFPSKSRSQSSHRFVSSEPLHTELQSNERAEVMEMLCRLEHGSQPIEPPLIEHLREHLPSLLTDATLINIGRHGYSHWVPLVQVRS